MAQRTAAPKVGQPLKSFSKLLVLVRLLANFNHLLVLVVAANVANAVRDALAAAVRAGNQFRDHQSLVSAAAALGCAADFLFG